MTMIVVYRISRLALVATVIVIGVVVELPEVQVNDFVTRISNQIE